jgi:hypothetical protein
MKRCATVLGVASLLASISVANAGELNRNDSSKLKRAIAQCLAYVSAQDPNGFAELYSDQLTKNGRKLRYVFNGCVASHGPILIWH